MGRTEQTLLEETVAQVEQEVFSNTESAETLIETLPGSVQEEIQQVKEEVPAEQIPQVTVPAETQQAPAEPEPAAPVPETTEVKPPETSIPAPGL